MSGTVGVEEHSVAQIRHYEPVFASATFSSATVFATTGYGATHTMPTGAMGRSCSGCGDTMCGGIPSVKDNSESESLGGRTEGI